MSWIHVPEAWVALITLTALEIVLGIDNIVFISVLTSKLPEAQRQRGRLVGLTLAMLTRILLLLTLAWIVKLEEPLLAVLGNEISGRDLILILGGLFLLAKSTHEIHDNLEGTRPAGRKLLTTSFMGVMVQVAILDIVFSLDSVITAVGMAQHVPVMVIAIVLAVLFMMVFARAIGDFVERHPTVKMLALSFLLLVGMALVADGLEFHIPKGYIYFAMGFSVFVEMLNLRLVARTQDPVRLRASLPLGKPTHDEERWDA
jgi:predicted tellurium resistance membrane protein TerC